MLRQAFCQRLAALNVFTMASGGQPPTFRFYLHAQPATSDTHLLVEVHFGFAFIRIFIFISLFFGSCFIYFGFYQNHGYLEHSKI